MTQPIDDAERESALSPGDDEDDDGEHFRALDRHDVELRPSVPPPVSTLINMQRASRRIE